MTIDYLTAAVRARDLPRVRSMLRARPELAQKGADNYSPLHYAVMNRDAEMVRVLMQHGASARHGVYPFRESTSALTLASERGFSEIVAAIEEEEGRRRDASSGLKGAPSPDELFAAIRDGDETRAIALMEADPALVQTAHPVFEWSPLHVAALALSARLVAWLLDRGADVTRRDPLDHTPLDLAARRSREKDANRFKAVATLLLGNGAALTPCAAAALGDAEWLRARSAEGVLVNPIDDDGGCLRVAVSHNRPDIVSCCSWRLGSTRTNAHVSAPSAVMTSYSTGACRYGSARHPANIRLPNYCLFAAPIRTPTCTPAERLSRKRIARTIER